MAMYEMYESLFWFVTAMFDPFGQSSRVTVLWFG